MLFIENQVLHLSVLLFVKDAAQVVSSSMCLTSMTETAGGDLHMTCTMRCLEVGTVGGGTILPPQRTCLKVFLIIIKAILCYTCVCPRNPF